MRSAELDYELPPELIAQRPADRRDASRLLVYDRGTGDIAHRHVSDLPREVGDALAVVNDTRVIQARLQLRRASGGHVEVPAAGTRHGRALGGARSTVAPPPRG